MLARPTFACPHTLGVHAHNCRSHRPTGSRCASTMLARASRPSFYHSPGPGAVVRCLIRAGRRAHLPTLACLRAHVLLSNRGLGPCVRGLAAHVSISRALPAVLMSAGQDCGHLAALESTMCQGVACKCKRRMSRSGRIRPRNRACTHAWPSSSCPGCRI